MPLTKEELEAAKIELEINHLKRPSYATPSFWISVVTALVAVAGVYGQSVLSKIESAAAKIESAQAVVDRDRALLAGERARKEVELIEQEREAKRKEVSALIAEGESLKAENKNQSEKLASLLTAFAAAPQSGREPEVKAAAQAAAKSLFSIAVYSLNVEQSRVDNATSALRAAGYSIIKVESLAARTAWLSTKSVVLYYHDATHAEAQAMAKLISAKAGLNVGVEKGAGIGIPGGKERTSLRVHLVQ